MLLRSICSKNKIISHDLSQSHHLIYAKGFQASKGYHHAARSENIFFGESDDKLIKHRSSPKHITRAKTLKALRQCSHRGPSAPCLWRSSICREHKLSVSEGMWSRSSGLHRAESVGSWVLGGALE